MKKVFFILLAIVALGKSNSYDDEICQSQLESFTHALSNREFWALELFDTWAKIQAGYLRGNVQNLGNFDQCSRYQYDTLSSGTIQGQYCLVTLQASPDSTLGSDNEGFDWREFASFIRNSSLHLTNGFCLPASCTPAKTVQYLNEEFLFKNDLIAYGASCVNDDHKALETIDIIAIVIFSLFLVGFINDTIYDLYKRSKNEVPNKFWSSFSIYTNGMKLFDMTKSKAPSAINCIHGLRVMSIIWIILGHRVGNHFFWGNPKDLMEYSQSPRFIIMSNNPIAVDTFFVLGAVLMTWAILRDCEKEQLNIGRIIWRRYLRYTPAYAALILFTISLFKYFINGPFPIATVSSLSDVCRKSWWAALLHIQNFLPHVDMCLNHGWYLSADFQLFLISPFIIQLIHKFGKKFLALPAILLGASIIYMISISVALGIKMPSKTVTATTQFTYWLYFPTQARCGPWFQGIILGFFLYKNRGQKLKINRFLNAFLWISVLSTQVLILTIPYMFSIREDTPQALNSIFIAFQRNTWALTICWIIFACHQLKTGGIIRWFLSHPYWQPIGRMGLSMYLVHPIYQIISMTNQRVPLYMNFWQIIPVYISDIVITAILATISYLAFEAPMLIVEEYLYKKIKNKV